MATELQKIKSEYPNAEYFQETLYPTPGSEDPILDGDGIPVDADYLIRDHYFQVLGTSVDSNYVKNELGGYLEAFTNV